MSIGKYAASGVFGVAAVLVSLPVIAADPKAAKSDPELIASAESAAPSSVSKNATVVVMDEKGMRTLRKGTNDWVCMPDDPGTPGNDPMCADPNAWAWMQAVMGHKNPPDKVGFMYMLQGGSDASNMDPYATEAKGGHWVTTGPHVMVVGPSVKAMTGYPRVADPDTSKPYVMYPGTPYEHLMIPVQ